MAQPELFINDFWRWCERNGVTFTDVTQVPFECRVDLNSLKAGIIQLIEVYGGDLGDR